MMEMFCIYAVHMAAISLMWLLSTWNVAIVTEKLNFKLYFIWIDLNINSRG